MGTMRERSPGSWELTVSTGLDPDSGRDGSPSGEDLPLVDLSVEDDLVSLVRHPDPARLISR
jgi:hypothetical protein